MTNILYLQDILAECSAPEKFNKPANPETSNTLIVDFGSWQCRAGLANETEPSLVFDSVVHRWKDENNVQLIKVGRTIPVGSNIRATSRSAFENGLPVHTPTIELIFDYILKHYAKTNLSLIMTETPMIPPYCRQEIMELIFEGYNCIDKVAFVLDGPAALPPSIPTALVIHIGATNTHIFPIIQDAIDWAQAKRINWGGVSAAEFLLKIMGLKYPGILNSTNPNKLTLTSAQAIWHKTALTASSVSDYESKQDALACPTGAALAALNCCIRLTGDAASEADRRIAVAEAKKAAALNQAALQEKRRLLADKLRQKSEEQREAKIRSKEHIYKALQGLVERVQSTLKKSTKKQKTKNLAEDEDISMEFSDNDEQDDDVEDSTGEDVIFNTQNLGDLKLFEELKRLGFASLERLQEGLRRAEEDFFRLSGQAVVTSTSQNLDFSLLSIADSELSEAEIKEKRRLRLIKSSADARERQKLEKAAEEAKKQAAAEALEWKRTNDLEGWRAGLYGKRREIIDRLIRKQKQRADRKGTTQGSRFRSVVALGESTEESTSSTNQPASGIPDSGPDDGFGLNDDDWLVYRQVSRDDEEDSDLQDQENLSQIEALLEEKDHVEFMKRLQDEQYASLTLLDRLTFGGDPEAEIEASAGQPSIHINSERMRCTEGLFQPLSIQGIDQAGLIEILINLFSAYPKEIQTDLVKNIYVSGGPAALPGLRERLTNEISAILSEDLVPILNLNISTDLEATWKGIKQRSLIPNLDFNWITRDKYFESKPEEEEQTEIVEEPKNKKKSKKAVETPAVNAPSVITGVGKSEKMKLDATQLRYMSKEEFRLLQTVEMGSRNHEIVPIALICRMTKLRPQTATRQLQALAKIKLVSFEADSKYDGVRLTYGGYDFLALKAFSSRETVVSVGQQIGVGKESDIYLVHGTHHFETVEDIDRADSDESDDEELVEEIESSVQISPIEYQERVLKIQRLGRTSFRTVKTNRDYHQHRSSCSWLYLSRLAAGLEYRFMKALRRVGLPVPKPLDWSRHCVVMELIKGTLFENVRIRDGHVNDFKSENAEEESDEEGSEAESEVFVENRVVDYVEEADLPGLYVRLMELIAELASYGLIHGDFNEFNLLLTRPERTDPSQPRVTPVIIDFPQMVSIDHENAEYYFNRDVECIRTFFAKRFHFVNETGLFEAKLEEVVRDEDNKLDVELRASGYVKPKRQKSKRVDNSENDNSESDSEESDCDESDSDSDSHANDS